MSMQPDPSNQIRYGSPVPEGDGLRTTYATRVTALDVWAFAVPALSFVEFTVVGRLILSEVLALALLPWLLRASGRLRTPRWFVLLWAGWFLSQIVTDLVVGSAFADYSRGWAKIFFTLTNFAAILALASTPRRARLFAVGLAVGGILGYAIFPENNVYAAIDPWKWAFALPLGLLLAASLSGPRFWRLPWLPIIAFAGFAIVNLQRGYRSLGGVALLSAMYLVLQTLVGRRMRIGRPPIGRAVFGLLFCLAAALAVVGIYDAAASRGRLGPEAQLKYLQQSGSLGVVVGGRYEALTSTQAILDSPLLGHGSWAKDPKYVYLLNQRLVSLGYSARITPVAEDALIPTHSYLLGAWVEAGVLGGAFWLAALALVAWLLASLYTVRLTLSPLLVYSSTLFMWDVLFSPYGNAGRLSAPFAIALCILGSRLLRQDRAMSDDRAIEPGTRP